MIKAVVTNGVLVPRDPLPADWQDGTEVTVEKSADSPEAIANVANADGWMDEVERVARQADPADDLRLEAAVGEVRKREKEFARKWLGMAS